MTTLKLDFNDEGECTGVSIFGTYTMPDNRVSDHPLRFTLINGAVVERYTSFEDDLEMVNHHAELQEAAQEPPAVLLPLLTPVEFKLMFTPMERIAIKGKRATDEILDDFMDIIDDPRLVTVDFNLQSTKDAIDYLVSIEVLTAERAVQVKTGVFL